MLLNTIWQLENLTEYKLHFARWNQKDNPLDVFVRSNDEWNKWQEYWPGRNDFNRKYIFTLMDFYHEKNIWLFGGVYEVTARHGDRYSVNLLGEGAEFIGRLKLYYPYSDRGTRVNLENHFENFVVSEILKEKYSGRNFPGYDNIELSFDELEGIVKNNRPDWMAALQSMKGIYLITDTESKMRYIGSAYGDKGLWGRWSEYISNGHGGNVELRKVVATKGIDYCRKSFRFALLEVRAPLTHDQTIIDREKFWKDILLTRDEYNMN